MQQGADPTDAQSRFGNAKSISSAAYFDRDSSAKDPERQARLAKFQGAGAISSDAYFGREQQGGSARSGDNLDMTATELVSKISLTAKQVRGDGIADFCVGSCLVG